MTVLILGIGRSGFAAAELAHRLGYHAAVTDACNDLHASADVCRTRDARVATLREKGIAVEYGSHTKEFFDTVQPDMIITSPGVPESAPPLIWARKEGVAVISEIEFAIRHTAARIVGITGTNGKTTTTALAGHVLSQAHIPCVVAGNIGTALSGVVEDARKDHILVLEISSFQLETVDSFHPAIAVWLNLTPDHLDRYGSMEAYRAAKLRIFQNMDSTDWAICWWPERAHVEPLLRARGIRTVWIDETGTWEATPDMPYGAYCTDGCLYTHFNGVTHAYGQSANMPLIGKHNQVNMLAVCAIAHILHVPDHVVEAGLSSFAGMPHRLQKVAEHNGVTYINDSKATNPDAVCKALESQTGPVILIAGGYDKGMDFAVLVPHVQEVVRDMILMGETADELHAACADVANITRVTTMEEAVAYAMSIATPGDTVLLSPGCASYDMYDDFSQRGDDFSACVQRCIHANPQQKETA